MKRGALQLAAAVALVLVLYGPGLNGQRYGDDLGFLAPASVHHPFFHFVGPHPHHPWYRPIEATVITLAQQTVGYATWPVHGLVFWLHALLALGVARAVLKLGFSGPQAAVAAAFLIVCQTAVLAVEGNDTVSQVLGALAGNAALWWFYQLLRRDGAAPPGREGSACVVCLAVALWSKESSVGYLVGLTLLALMVRPGPGRVRRRALACWLSAAVLTAAYLLVRRQITAFGPSFGEGGYNLHLGLNVPLNAAGLLAVALLPISTVTMYDWATAHWWPGLAAAGLATLLVLVVVVVGWWRNGRARLGFGLLVMAVCGLLPTILLNHVSELYAYGALPALSILVGVGLGRELGRARPVATTLMVVFLLVHAAGTQQKVALMVDNGRRATALIEQLRPLARELPPQGRLALFSPPRQRIYSAFVLDHTDVLEMGLTGVKVMLERPDIELRIVDAGELRRHPLAPGERLAALRDGRLQPVRPEDL